MGTQGASPPAPAGGTRKVVGGKAVLAVAEEHTDVGYLAPWVSEQLMEGLFSKTVFYSTVYSYLEQNKTLSKEEKHFYANLLTKKTTKNYGGEKQSCISLCDGVKIKAQNWIT